jgi:hypothetical protein
MNANEILAVLRRVLLLDRTVFQQVRDDPGLTGPAAAGAAIAVLIAGLGAWLYGQTVWDGVGFGFFDTVILGTLFTIILVMAGFGITYVVLIQALRIDIAPDALVRLLAVGHLPYALGLLVFFPDLGYAFGLLSILGVFWWTLFALRSALPAASELKLAASVVAGMAVWMAIIPFISGSDNEFVTGVFVYGLIA